MKKLFSPLLLSAFLTLACTSFSSALDSKEAGRLQIIDGTICLKISSLKCLGSNTQFPSDVGKLYCFTRIVGALNPISVTHVWYFGVKERWRVSLAVKSSDWRSYSSKTIRPQEIGDWSVEILGPRGEALGLYKFEICPTSGQDKALKIIGNKIELQIGEQGIDRLYIDLNHYTTPAVLVLGGAAPRVAIHIMNVSFWDGRPEIPVNGKIIKQVRSKWHYNSETLRILLDLAPNINYAIKSYHKSKRTYCVEVSENRPGE